MSSICVPREEIKGNAKRKTVSALHGALALTILWVVNISIILFGWPFLLYGKLKYRKRQPESGRVP